MTYALATLALVVLVLAPLMYDEERARASREARPSSLVASLARGEVAPLALTPRAHEDERARLALAHARACARLVVAREATSDARDVALAREILATCDEALARA